LDSDRKKGLELLSAWDVRKALPYLILGLVQRPKGGGQGGLLKDSHTVAHVVGLKDQIYI